MAIAAVVLIAAIGFSNVSHSVRRQGEAGAPLNVPCPHLLAHLQQSYFIIRIAFVLQPILVIVAAVRGGFMVNRSIPCYYRLSRLTIRPYIDLPTQLPKGAH